MCGAWTFLILPVKPRTPLPTNCRGVADGQLFDNEPHGHRWLHWAGPGTTDLTPSFGRLCLQDPEASLSNLQKLVFSTTGVRAQHQRLVVEGEHMFGSAAAAYSYTLSCISAWL